MRTRDLTPALLAFLSLAARTRAAFLLDWFTGESCYNNGCLRALSSSLPTASSDCSALHASAATDLPSYASPCWNTHRYSRACSCIGVTPTPSGTTTTTTTVPFTSRPTVNDGNIIVPKDARVRLDATMNLDVICQSKVADAVQAIATQVGSVVRVTATQTKTKTSVSISTTTSVSTTTKVTFSGLMSCPATTVTVATASAGAGVQGVVVNAAATAATSTASSVATPTGCLKDAEATAIVDAFKSMWSSAEKDSVKKVAESLLADEFIGMSTGVNSLRGEATSNMTFPDTASFVLFVDTASPIPEMTTLDIFHDCNRIAWYWAAKPSGKEERGVSLIYTFEEAMADLSDGVVDAVDSVGSILGGGTDGYGGRKVNMLMWEFDSLGWGR